MYIPTSRTSCVLNSFLLYMHYTKSRLITQLQLHMCSDTYYKSVGLYEMVETFRDTGAVLLGRPGTCLDSQHSRAQGYPKRGAHLR